MKKRNPQISKQELEELSKNRANEITSKLAALHDPDQVVGGFFSEIKHMGRRDVNGAIGGSWSGGRVNQLIEAARKQKANGDTKMNVSLTSE